jgi:hypothetical protein
MFRQQERPASTRPYPPNVGRSSRDGNGAVLKGRKRILPRKAAHRACNGTIRLGEAPKAGAVRKEGARAVNLVIPLCESF